LSARWPHGPRHEADGITLIELVVAMAVFALVATMGLQALTATLHQRDRLAEIDTSHAELSTAIGLMRNDLSSIVPMLFYPPGARPVSAVTFSPAAGLAMSLGGQVSLSGQGGAGFARVEWALDPESGTLRRQSWGALYPATASALNPAQKVLEGVSELSVRSYWPQLGWTEGVVGRPSTTLSSSGGADEDDAVTVVQSYSDTLPLALEITLVTERFGPVRLVETLQ